MTEKNSKHKEWTDNDAKMLASILNDHLSAQRRAEKVAEIWRNVALQYSMQHWDEVDGVLRPTCNCAGCQLYEKAELYE